MGSFSPRFPRQSASSAGRTSRFIIRFLIGNILALSGFAVEAQTTTYTELNQTIKAPNAVARLGPDLFGDTVNLYNGKLEFTQTDVNLVGNNALPVAVARHLETGRLALQGHPFGLWDLEIPRIHGVFSSKNGFVSDTKGGGRCSNFSPPPFAVGTNNLDSFDPEEFWGGTFLYVPGFGDQQLLIRNSNVLIPSAPGPVSEYPVVTKNFWYASCLSVLKNDPTQGEGFLVLAPNGTTYEFDQIVSYYATTITKPRSVDWLSAPLSLSDAQPSSLNGGGDIRSNVMGGTSTNLTRKEVWLLPTKITDRFGNSVTYTYGNPNQPKNVTSIVSSDGRSLSFTYYDGTAVDATAIRSVTDGTRTWNYSYHGSLGSSSLDKVTLPDNMTWSFANTDALVAEVTGLKSTGCTSTTPSTFNTAPAIGSMIHPSGAIGSFTLNPTAHGRSNTGKFCLTYDTSGHTYNLIPALFYTNSLGTKKLAGPGLPSGGYTWTYRYGATNASYAPCTGSCPTTKTVSVTDPAGYLTRYTFGNKYHDTEGKLLQTDAGWDTSSSTALRSTQEQYLPPGSAPFATPVGYSGLSTDIGDNYFNSFITPETQRIITQQGVRFTYQVNGFDGLARPDNITRSNSQGTSRTEATVFYDNAAKYVLGQVETVTDDSGNLMVSNTYDPDSASLLTTSKFGLLEKTLTYYADGTVHTSADGNGQTTSYSDYVAGLPKTTNYADGTNSSADVTAIGYINSMTDENNNTTAFGYDAIGRLNRIRYPREDNFAWNDTTILVELVGASELGIAGTHWRQTISTGNARTSTYFDGLLRPLLTRTYDAAAPGITKDIVHNYDFNGNTTFEAFPMSSISSIISATRGATTSYDVLGRPTSVVATGTNGNLTTSFSYGSPFTTTVTNPRLKSTTTRFFALDQPTTDSPKSIAMPLGINVTIGRDIYGKPISITRGDASVSATRSYVYDGYQRLCKTVEPETGATVEDYDGANNIAWRATGLSLTSISSCDTGSVPSSSKVSFAYDARNRLTDTTYSDGSSPITRSYTPNGQQKTVTSNGATWTTTYFHRGLPQTDSLRYGGSTYKLTNTYDANGSLAQLTYPDSTSVSFAPNALGEASMIGTFATAITRFPNNAIASFTYGNGIAHTLTQYPNLLPRTATDIGVVQDLYTYDADNNVASITDQIGGGTGTRAMTYDDLDRLVSVGAPAIWGNATYTIDAIDNIRKSVLSAGPTARSLNHNYDSANRLISTTNGPAQFDLNYAYDAQGNVTERGGQAYVFDQGNRLTSAVGKETYYYDGFGHRVKSVATDGRTTIFIYRPEGQLLYVSQSGGVSRAATTKYYYLDRHVIAEATTVGGATTTLYDHTDGLGSPVVKTNAGRVLDSAYTRYEPFGNVAFGAVPTIGFAGHVNDSDTGLDYMQQRYYDPVAGRFLSIDPVVTDAKTGGSFNRYVYANNSPYKYLDTDGRQATLAACGLGPGGCAFGIVATIVGAKAIADTVHAAENHSGGNSASPAVGQGCIYCVPGDKTSTGKDYIGSTDDLDKRSKDSSDGRDRKGADVIDTYPVGDREERRRKEQQAINDKGGVSETDNRRNEIRETKWGEKGVKPPTPKPPEPKPPRPRTNEV